MITFDEGMDRFNFRVAGVAVHEEMVLLHKSEEETFWTFPGGRAEFGEPAEETLKREMREEIATEVKVLRLLWFVESFFTYAERRYHEIALYFLMQLPATSEHLVRPGPFPGKEEDGTTLIFQWFPQRSEVLSSLPLLPSFLQTAVLKPPDSIEHIVHYGE